MYIKIKSCVYTHHIHKKQDYYIECNGNPVFFMRLGNNTWRILYIIIIFTLVQLNEKQPDAISLRWQEFND